jgi:hypothetical protein
MKSALVTRLKRLENAGATDREFRVEVQRGYLNKLPREYIGERHIVSIGRLPDGNHQFEERPGPEPRGLDDSNVLRVRTFLMRPARE